LEKLMKQNKFLRRPSALLLGVLCLGVVGCGGSGGTSGGGTNAFAGSYSGEFIDQDDVIATCTMTVDATGAVNGQFNYGTPLTFTGQVNGSGAGTIQDSNGSLPITFGSSGHPTLGVGIGTSTTGFFMTLISNPTGSFSGFSGDYAGTVHNTTLNKTGIIALSVNSGVVSGVDLFTVNGSPALKGVSGTLTSGGVLTYTVDGVTVTGTVTLSGTTISGPVQESNGNAATLSVNQVEP
jgi:hypothetical protein